MSIGFQIIHGSIVIFRQKTVFKQALAYHRNKEVYVKAGGGYVRLRLDGSTSHPDILWEEMEGVKGIRNKSAGKGQSVEYKS